MSQIFGDVRKSSFRGLVLQKIRWFLFSAVIRWWFILGDVDLSW